VVDPFQPRQGWIARLARLLGCTEGQLYSMVVGLLLLWTISANGLPDVVWNRDSETPAATRAVAPSARPSVDAPSPGLLAAPTHERELSPVTTAPFDAGGESTSAPPLGAADPAGSDGDTEAVRVASGGYASTAAGTPLATAGVPDGSVAVGRRGTQTDKVAYLRLTGGGTPLELTVDPEGVSTFADLAELRLCIVTEKRWAVGQGDVTPANAPDVDCSDAVSGKRSTTGDRWTFDVSSLDLSAIPGVAILPGADALAPDFQVVFTTTT
jgi:hypothetical protein